MLGLRTSAPLTLIPLLVEVHSFSLRVMSSPFLVRLPLLLGFLGCLRQSFTPIQGEFDQGLALRVETGFSNIACGFVCNIYVLPIVYFLCEVEPG